MSPAREVFEAVVPAWSLGLAFLAGAAAWSAGRAYWRFLRDCARAGRINRAHQVAVAELDERLQALDTIPAELAEHLRRLEAYRQADQVGARVSSAWRDLQAERLAGSYDPVLEDELVRCGGCHRILAECECGTGYH